MRSLVTKVWLVSSMGAAVAVLKALASARDRKDVLILASEMDDYAKDS